MERCTQPSLSLTCYLDCYASKDDYHPCFSIKKLLTSNCNKYLIKANTATKDSLKSEAKYPVSVCESD